MAIFYFCRGGGWWALACAITTTTEISTTYKCCLFKTGNSVFKTPTCLAISFGLGIISHKVFFVFFLIRDPHNFALLTTNEPRNMPLAKLFISCTGQCPVFRNNNLRTSGSFGTFLIAVTKFQDKFASLWEKQPFNQDKSQIRWTDMYLVRFLPNFAGFHWFAWISRLCNRVKFQKPCVAGR